MAVAFGLSKEEALKAITINPAEILGVDDHLGSLEEGKVANIILTAGDPLEVTTNVRYLFIAGEPVDLNSKHTELYEKFSNRPGPRQYRVRKRVVPTDHPGSAPSMHSCRPNKHRTRTGRRRWHIRVVMLRAVGLMALLLSLSVSVAAQAPDFTLNVNVDLVELQVTVLDERDRNVANLREADFQIFEDRIEQQIQLFRHDDQPVSLGLIIDNSRSMDRRKDRVDTAAVSFVRLNNPQDEAFLIHFDDTVRLANDFTADVSLLEDTLASISPYGQTALYDAIIEGLDKMAEGKYDQKAILLVSDGADNASVQGFAQVLEKVRSTDVAVYPIGLLNNSVAGRRAREALSEIADLSGGRAFFPQSVDEIPVLTERIARELRELYTLGYSPSNARRDSTWRSVRIQVRTPPETQRYKTNYRHGYYSPGP